MTLTCTKIVTDNQESLRISRVEGHDKICIPYQKGSGSRVTGSQVEGSLGRGDLLASKIRQEEASLERGMWDKSDSGQKTLREQRKGLGSNRQGD